MLWYLLLLLVPFLLHLLLRYHLLSLLLLWNSFLEIKVFTGLALHQLLLILGSWVRRRGLCQQILLIVHQIESLTYVQLEIVVLRSLHVSCLLVCLRMGWYALWALSLTLSQMLLFYKLLPHLLLVTMALEWLLFHLILVVFLLVDVWRSQWFVLNLINLRIILTVILVIIRWLVIKQLFFISHILRRWMRDAYVWIGNRVVL